METIISAKKTKNKKKSAISGKYSFLPLHRKENKMKQSLEKESSLDVAHDST